MKVAYTCRSSGEETVVTMDHFGRDLMIWFGAMSLLITLEDWRALNAKVEECAATLGGES